MLPRAASSGPPVRASVGSSACSCPSRARPPARRPACPQVSIDVYVNVKVRSRTCKGGYGKPAARRPLKSPAAVLYLRREGGEARFLFGRDRPEGRYPCLSADRQCQAPTEQSADNRNPKSHMPHLLSFCRTYPAGLLSPCARSRTSRRWWCSLKPVASYEHHRHRSCRPSSPCRDLLPVNGEKKASSPLSPIDNVAEMASKVRRQLVCRYGDKLRLGRRARADAGLAQRHYAHQGRRL